jgi:hypothetical protein
MQGQSPCGDREGRFARGQMGGLDILCLTNMQILPEMHRKDKLRSVFLIERILDLRRRNVTGAIRSFDMDP